MDYSANVLRYGVRPEGPRAGRAPSQVPRMDSPFTTGDRPPHRRQDASCSSTRSTFSSGKDNNISLDAHNSVPRSKRRERNEKKQDFASFNIIHFNICGLATKKVELKNFSMTTRFILPCYRKLSMWQKQTSLSLGILISPVTVKTAKGQSHILGMM